MLARLNVRTKLLVILLPLLLAVGVFAGLGIRDRIAERSTANDARTMVGVARSGAEVVYRLQLERLHEVALGAGLESPMVDPAKATDLAIASFRSQLSQLDSVDQSIGNQPASTVARNLERSVAQVSQARAIRPGAGSAPQAISDAYSDIIDSIQRANAGLVAANGSSTAGGSSSRWLAQASEADARVAAEAALVIGATARGDLSGTQAVAQDISELMSSAKSWTAVFMADTNEFGRNVYSQVLADKRFTDSQTAFSGLADLSPDSGFTADPSTWVAAGAGRIDALWTAQKALLDREIQTVDTRVASLERQLRLYAGGSAAALILGLLLATTVTRLITTALSQLTTAARVISKESLPRLVESLNHPETDLVLAPTPITIKGNDEFSELAEAFGAVEQTAMDVAAAQSTALRKGISEIFVNLARRNQSLLDRQIEFIDRLETNEEDPDQLENLFKLDHLATRMRRNAESLLVLAGAEAPRRRGREVAMADVIRVAVGEVEDFARVHLIAIDPVEVRGTAAVDIAHLLSELMENGTQYSAPDRRVEVVGHSTNDGGYVVSISDEGMGMSAEAVAEANLQLARPPIIGLSLSRSLGFIVAGTLAARHRVKVSLTDSPSGGITALVALPPELLVRHAGYDPDLPPSAISEHAVPAPATGFTPSVHAVPVAEPDWLQAAPEFAADEPLRASFEVSDQAEPGGWVPTEDQAAERQIDPLRAFHLEGDPFADFAAEPTPEQAPVAPVGAAFEAGIVSMIAGSDQPRPVEPRVDEPAAPDGSDGQSSWLASAGDPEVEPDRTVQPATAGPEAPDPTAPTGPRRVTMWQAPERAPLPALPGIVGAAMQPAPIPASISADLDMEDLATDPARHADARHADAPVAAHPDPVAPTVTAVPELPHRVVAPTPVASPMTPLLGEPLPRRSTPEEVAEEAATADLVRASESQRATESQRASESLAEMTSALPRRQRNPVPPPAPAAGPLVGAPSRPPDEVRNILSRYRSGLDQGRLTTQDQTDAEPVAEPVVEPVVEPVATIPFATEGASDAFEF